MSRKSKLVASISLVLILFFSLGLSVGYITGKSQSKTIEKEIEVIKYIEVIPEEKTEETKPKEILETTAENKEPELVSLGTFTATAYCPCYSCSEGYGTSTATGATATEGTTIAVDPKVIPYGTEVIIDGHTYIAQDCGGAIKGNKIDIYFNTHSKVAKFGKKKVEVFVKG